MKKENELYYNLVSIALSASIFCRCWLWFRVCGGRKGLDDDVARSGRARVLFLHITRTHDLGRRHAVGLRPAGVGSDQVLSRCALEVEGWMEMYEREERRIHFKFYWVEKKGKIYSFHPLSPTSFFQINFLPYLLHPLPAFMHRHIGINT